MLRVHNLLLQMRFGLAATLIIVTGSALFVWNWGPLFGVSGRPEIVLGGLVVTAAGLAGVEMAARQPNPYARTYALYDLRDVPPARDLESGGSGWIIQSVPLIASAAILVAIFLIF